MKVEEFKLEVKEKRGDIKFDGHVTKVISNITGEKQKLVLKWIDECKAGTERPEPCKKFRSMMAFIYKSSDNSIRGILTKEKGSYFIELFLDKHKYYDRKRRYLGL